MLCGQMMASLTKLLYNRHAGTQDRIAEASSHAC